MKNYKLAIFALAGALAFTSCKKDEENEMTFQSAGTITGTLSGTSVDGQAMNESFSYSQNSTIYDNKVSNDTLRDYNITTGKLVKTPVKRFYITASLKNVGSMTLNFVTDGSTPVITSNSVNNNTFSFYYIKSLTGNQILNYSTDGADIKTETGTGKFVASNVVISEFTFDEPSGKVTGKYYFVVNQQDSKDIKREATLKGDFTATVYKTVN